MTRQTAIRLLITSGDGPHECCLAVAHVLRRLEQEARDKNLLFRAEIPGNLPEPPSALVSLTGEGAERLAMRWRGTVQWTCPSPFRPHHKRRNWFVGVFGVRDEDHPEAVLDLKSLKVETFRSGGPGGQHQNTTDSGVRVTHTETGVCAVSTDERSQHRNRQVALDRLAAKLILQEQERLAREKSTQNLLHRQLERGNPVRRFKGVRFSEIS
ncbi:peptide chain release factor H [Roseibium sp.]|uniref:peptide chain release factor H n=1 Tax=Roseibium sp. TaxID=1936156 RepID=UPI003D1446A0